MSPEKEEILAAKKKLADLAIASIQEKITNIFLVENDLEYAWVSELNTIATKIAQEKIDAINKSSITLDEAKLEESTQTLKKQIEAVMNALEHELAQLAQNAIEQIEKIHSNITSTTDIKRTLEEYAEEALQKLPPHLQMVRELSTSIKAYINKNDYTQYPLVELSIKGQEKKFDASIFSILEFSKNHIQTCCDEAEETIARGNEALSPPPTIVPLGNGTTGREVASKDSNAQLLPLIETSSSQPNLSFGALKKPSEVWRLPRERSADNSQKLSAPTSENEAAVKLYLTLAQTFEKLYNDPIFQPEENQKALQQLEYNLIVLAGGSMAINIKNYTRTGRLEKIDKQFIQLTREEQGKYKPLGNWRPDRAAMEKALDEAEQAFATTATPADFSFFWYYCWVPILNVLIDLVNLILNLVSVQPIARAPVSAAQGKFKESGIRVSVEGLFAVSKAEAPVEHSKNAETQAHEI